MHCAAERGLEEGRVRLSDHRREAQVLGVIRHHEKIQGAGQPRAHADAGGDLLALGEAVGLVRPEPVADHAGVCGVGRVDVRVAPEHAVGIVALQVGGVLRFRRFDVARVDVEILRQGWQRQAEGQQAREGRMAEWCDVHNLGPSLVL